MVCDIDPQKLLPQAGEYAIKANGKECRLEISQDRRLKIVASSDNANKEGKVILELI